MTDPIGSEPLRYPLGRRRFMAAFAFGFVAMPLAAEAQRDTKVYRVGILSSDSAQDPRVRAFREGLRDLGYVEDRNLIIIGRWADGDLARLPKMAAELIASQVEVIVTLGPAAWAAKQQTRTVPIVIAFSGDTVATGIVPSLARPGGNITGVSFMSTDLAAKRIELLKEAFPRIAIALTRWPRHRSSAKRRRLRERWASSWSSCRVTVPTSLRASLRWPPVSESMR